MLLSGYVLFNKIKQMIYLLKEGTAFTDQLKLKHG